MSELDSMAGTAVNAALIGVTLLPIGVIWALSLRRNAGFHSQVAKMAHNFIQAALPVLTIGVALAIVTPAALASNSQNTRLNQTIVYISLTSSFIIVAADILIASALYAAGIGVLYLALGRPKWWKLLRMDALCGAGLLLAIDIAYWAMQLSAIRLSRDLDGTPLDWLLLIVDITLALLAAGVVGLVVYIWPKFKMREHLAASNIRVLLLTASLLWLLHCAFVLAVDLKTVIPDWTYEEILVQKILNPIFDLWTSAAVLGLLAKIFRDPLWSDPTAIIDDPGHGVTQQPFYFQPQRYQQPSVYQYGQQPVVQ
ncbi:hypothetical protein MMYC01_205673 [Madurella mycetomatis]|uniref:Uncharacterized protein n=1 Tax=Madurella mycetomatis TaxID=100816 RepID=A0A175W6P5_9PEZI|nr:hypothetical protein MMYC01_205673 [Madurella mycetomatis]